MPALLAGLLTVLVLVTGCSSTSGSDSAATVAGGSDLGAADPPAPAARAATVGAAHTLVQSRSVIKTGELALTSPHLSRVRREIDALLAGLGGTVDRERTVNDRHGDVASSTLVLRVPAAASSGRAVDSPVSGR
jgi:hypothetical protein